MIDIKNFAISVLQDTLKKAKKENALLDPEKVKNILEEATSYGLSGESLSQTDIFNKLDYIISMMKIWMNEYILKQRIYEKRRYLNRQTVAKKLNKNITSVTGFDTSQYYSQFKNSKAQVDYEIAKQQFLDCIKDGLKLWEAFRSFITHQNINYSILYKDGDILYEAKEITLEEFLSRAQLNLRYDKRSTKSNAPYIIEIKSMSREDLSDGEEEFVGAPFFDQLVRHYGYLADKGAIYETYTRIMKFERFPNEVKEKWFDYPNMEKKIKEWTIANKADWSSGRKVGDQGLTQNKNIAYRETHLSAIRTLYSDIENLVRSYEGDRTKLVSALIKLFTEDIENKNVHLTNETRIMNEKAVQEILRTFE